MQRRGIGTEVPQILLARAKSQSETVERKFCMKADPPSVYLHD